MGPNVRPKILNCRGVATVEKLTVLMLVICFLGATFAIVGPMLAEKYQWAANMMSLGGAPTVAQKELITSTTSSSSGSGVVVVLFLLAIAASSIFVIPMFFPRAHRFRHEVVRSVARRFPVVRAIAEVNLTGEYSIRDLKGMADENRSNSDRISGGSERQREKSVRPAGALEIAAALVDAAGSADATMARPVSEKVLAANAVPTSTPGPVPGASPKLMIDRNTPLIEDDDEATRVSIDRPSMGAMKKMKGAISDDAIPFFDDDEPTDDETHMMIARPSFDATPDATSLDVFDDKTDPLQ